MVTLRWQGLTWPAARRPSRERRSRPSWPLYSRRIEGSKIKVQLLMSLAEAVRQLLPKAEVTAVAGTGVVPKEPTDIPAAVEAARNADVVILTIGGRSSWSGERTEGEGSDTANIDLPPQQVELINVVAALGKPIVAVISMGRPYTLASVIDKLPAVTAATAGPGTRAGRGGFTLARRWRGSEVRGVARASRRPRREAGRPARRGSGAPAVRVCFRLARCRVERGRRHRGAGRPPVARTPGPGVPAAAAGRAQVLVPPRRLADQAAPPRRWTHHPQERLLAGLGGRPGCTRLMRRRSGPAGPPGARHEGAYGSWPRARAGAGRLRDSGTSLVARGRASACPSGSGPETRSRRC